jgi:hypothetical protein
MAEVLKAILLDPVLDDTIVVKVTVDVAAKVMNPKDFDFSMTEILREVFEGEAPERDVTLVNADEGERQATAGSQDPEVENRTSDSEETERGSTSFQEVGPTPARNRTSTSTPSAIDEDDGVVASGIVAGNLDDIPCSLPSTYPCTGESVPPWATSTPKKTQRMTVADKIQQLKGEVSQHS